MSHPGTSRRWRPLETCYVHAARTWRASRLASTLVLQSSGVGRPTPPSAHHISLSRPCSTKQHTMDQLTEEIESVSFVAREVMGELLQAGCELTTVYQVPPRTSAQGYKAAEWDVEKFLWKGRLRVIEVGARCDIRLEVSPSLRGEPRPIPTSAIPPRRFRRSRVADGRTRTRASSSRRRRTPPRGRRSSPCSTARGTLCCGSRATTGSAPTSAWGSSSAARASTSK